MSDKPDPNRRQQSDSPASPAPKAAASDRTTSGDLQKAFVPGGAVASCGGGTQATCDASAASHVSTSQGGNPGFSIIDREALHRKAETESPDNQDRTKGWALVNVLSREQFAKGHIPGSINIPKAEVAGFETRFDKNKEIVVYCASPECDASANTARELVRRGFQHVVDFAGGLSNWQDGGKPVQKLEG